MLDGILEGAAILAKKQQNTPTVKPVMKLKIVKPAPAPAPAEAPAAAGATGEQAVAK